MQHSMRRLARVFAKLARFTLYIAGTCLVLMTIVVAAQVASRYLLGTSLIWSEPMAVQMMGWFIFLGAAVGTREGYHLSFDILLMVLPAKAVSWCNSLSDFFVGAFGFGMFWYGAELVVRTWGSKMPSLGIPEGTNFLPLVFGGMLVFLYSGERLLRRASGLQTVRFGEELIED